MVHQTLELSPLPVKPASTKSTASKAKRKSTRSYLGTSGKSTASKASNACYFCGSSEMTGSKFPKCSTKSDAQAWGRTAAVLNWSLDELAYEVEEELHEVAKASYVKRMAQLQG